MAFPWSSEDLMHQSGTTMMRNPRVDYGGDEVVAPNTTTLVLWCSRWGSKGGEGIQSRPFMEARGQTRGGNHQAREARRRSDPPEMANEGRRIA
jgi:hypothetical protein